MEGSNYWGYGHKTQHSYPRSLYNHLKKTRGEIWPKRSERRNNTKNYQDEDKKSAIDKKNNSQTVLKTLHDNNLRLSLDKCLFLQTSLDYLVFHIDPDIISTIEKKKKKKRARIKKNSSPWKF